jgi:hypothetical protein
MPVTGFALTTKKRPGLAFQDRGASLALAWE